MHVPPANGPVDHTPPADPSRALSDPPRFLATGALGDPTLRTPGSEIPEAVYAASDTESFGHLQARSPMDTLPTRNNPRIGLVVALLFLAILAATAIYLSRHSHTPASPQPASPAKSSTSSSTCQQFALLSSPHVSPAAPLTPAKRIKPQAERRKCSPPL